MSSLTKYRYTWGRGACRYPLKNAQKTLLEAEHTHTFSCVFMTKGHDNSFQETAIENEFCFPKLLQQEQALLASYGCVCTLYREPADPTRSTGKQASHAPELPVQPKLLQMTAVTGQCTNPNTGSEHWKTNIAWRYENFSLSRIDFKSQSDHWFSQTDFENSIRTPARIDAG